MSTMSTMTTKTMAASVAACAVIAGFGAPVAAAEDALFLGGTGGGVLRADQVARYWWPNGADTHTAIDYPASGEFGSSIAAGLSALREAMAEHRPVTVAGVSQGALVIRAYQAYLATSKDDHPDPADVTFVLYGDPANARTGLVRVVPVLKGLLGLPDEAVNPVDTPYHTITVTREYDFFADFPNAQPWNVLAVANAVAGWVFVHTDYEGDLLATPGTKYFSETNAAGGTNDYYLVPTKHLPLTQPLRWFMPSPVVDTIDKFLRPAIDMAYDRDPRYAEVTPTKDAAPVVAEDVSEVTEAPEDAKTPQFDQRPAQPEESVPESEPEVEEPKVEVDDDDERRPAHNVVRESLKADPETKAEPANASGDNKPSDDEAVQADPGPGPSDDESGGGDGDE